MTLSRLMWHVLVFGGLLVNGALIAWVVWRLWRLKHPVVVYVPPRDINAPIDRDVVSEIVDSNAATRGHMGAMADKVAGEVEHQKVTMRAQEGILRKIAKVLGISTDEF